MLRVSRRTLEETLTLCFETPLSVKQNYSGLQAYCDSVELTKENLKSFGIYNSELSSFVGSLEEFIAKGLELSRKNRESISSYSFSGSPRCVGWKTLYSL